MSQNFLYNASFHSLLNTIDQELADQAKEKGCSYCGNQLDQADYPRSPFGLPAQFRTAYEERFSFCCADCRKRTTPTSVRFFGRRWYPAPLLVLISVLTLGINERRLTQIKQHFGMTVSQSTWRRWRRWWRESFIETRFWQQAKGQLLPTPAITRGPYPRVLLDAFQGDLEEKIGLLLQFFAPLSAGSLRAI